MAKNKMFGKISCKLKCRCGDEDFTENGDWVVDDIIKFVEAFLKKHEKCTIEKFMWVKDKQKKRSKKHGK